MDHIIKNEVLTVTVSDHGETYRDQWSIAVT